LPYLIDGTHKITQSNAILRYIARKHNLCGESEKEQIREDILENQFMQLAKLCYDPDFALPEMLKLYSQFLGKQPWFLGDKITFV
ncbi:GSTM2 isoform 11, partial [Pan troglodytes]